MLEIAQDHGGILGYFKLKQHSAEEGLRVRKVPILSYALDSQVAKDLLEFVYSYYTFRFCAILFIKRV